MAADMGGMGFISVAGCEVLHNNALINLHMAHTAAEMGVPRCGAEEERSTGAAEQRSKGARVQGGRGAEEQGSRGEEVPNPKGKIQTREGKC